MVAKPTREIVIHEFRGELAPEFARLNYEWIEKAYSIEEHDREILDHPYEQIIAPGGQIFFACSDNVVLGTVALIEFGGNTFELAKMAVSPESRGLGIGNKLMAACIGYAKVRGRDKIILESNTRQAAAIALYRKFGFVETPLDPQSHFVRANIRMELNIDPQR